jgi:predicted O-methyltransferase YrrM
MKGVMRTGYARLPSKWRERTKGIYNRLPGRWKRILLRRLIWPTSRSAFITHWYAERWGLSVRHGPFAGMRYPTEALGRVDALVAKLLGAYESELHDAIRMLVATRPRIVVNIGCADGYYAVGMARALPCSKVFAFDLDRSARRMCTALAEANGVRGRVRVLGRATAEDLRKLPLRSAAILCDCEGDEIELLRPAAVPALTSCQLLVELHEFVQQDVLTQIARRYSTTHRLTIIRQERRMIAGYSELSGLSLRDRQQAVAEYRPMPMRWALLTLDVQR